MLGAGGGDDEVSEGKGGGISRTLSVGFALKYLRISDLVSVPSPFLSARSKTALAKARPWSRPWKGWEAFGGAGFSR